MQNISLKGAARAAGRLLGGLGKPNQPGINPKVSNGTPSRGCPIAGKASNTSSNTSSISSRNARFAAKLPKPTMVRSSTLNSGRLVEASLRPSLNVREASPAQQDHIRMVFGRMLAVVHNLQEAVVPVGDFKRLVEDAAAADMFAVWPFRGSSGITTNMVTADFYLPDLIHSASLMQRFDHVFPYMELLFSHFSARSLQPNSAPCLHEALSLLAEAHDLPQTSQQTKHGIARLMQQWGIMRIPIINDVGVWSSEPQPSRIGLDSRETVLWVVGSLQAQRQPTSDCSSAAVQQLVAVPPQPFPLPADAPQGLYLAEAVQAIVDKAVQEARFQERMDQRGPRPHGRWAIKKYMRDHTWRYTWDFNKEMLAKKRHRDAIQRELESSIDLMPFTSLLRSADSGGEDVYL